MPFFFSVYWCTKVLNFWLVITAFILLYGSITYFYPLKIFLPYRSRSISTYINLFHGYLLLRISTSESMLVIAIKVKLVLHVGKILSIMCTTDWTIKKYTWKLIHKTKVCFQISLHFHSLKSFRKSTSLIWSKVNIQYILNYQLFLIKLFLRQLFYMTTEYISHIKGNFNQY